MDKQHCHSCGQTAQIICFCRKVILCERCVGKHLMDEPSLSHKPCTLWSEEAKVYEEHLHVLKVKEDQFLAEARKKQELAQTAKRKIAEGIHKLQALKPVITDYVSLAMEVVTKQLPSLAEKLSQEMTSASEDKVSTLEAALQHFEGLQKHPDNEIVQLLESMKNPAEMSGLDLVTCKLDMSDISVEEVIRAGITFEVSLMKRPKLKERPEIVQSKSETAAIGPKHVAKTAIPKPGTPVKKATKPDTKKPSKIPHSLNQSQDSRLTDDRSDFSSQRLSKKLSELKAEQQKLTRVELSKDISAKLEACSEDETDLMKGESPSPEPPLQRQPMSVQDYGLKRFATQTEESVSEKKFTKLHAARSNRQTSLKDTERKLQELEAQWKTSRDVAFPD